MTAWPETVARQSLCELIESVLLDAYGVDEELTAFFPVFGDALALPCPAKILDIDVEVLASDIEGDERRVSSHVASTSKGAPASCRSPTSASVATRWRWLHAALRTWLGLKAFPPRRPAAGAGRRREDYDERVAN